MRMYTELLVFLLVMIAIPDTYFYLKLKDRNVRPIYILLHLIPPVFFTTIFLYVKFGMDNSQNFRVIVWIMWMYFVFLLIYIPKLIHILFFFLHAVYVKLFKRESIYFTVVRIVLSITVVIFMLISAYITPRNFDVTHVQVTIPDLPPAFDGYKIVQISDIHLGSWNYKFNKLQPVIKLINNQHADIIVFTGDMVNNLAGEADGWRPYFLQMKALGGKYAILGNHDYGDYTNWKSIVERNENRSAIKQHIRGFGFRLLLNEHVFLKKGTDSLELIGVENWGKTAASRYCDLNKAIGAKQASVPLILLSHDPNHWDAEVVAKKPVVLTLAGHTHASQLGIKLGKHMFSPVAILFKHWVGLYKENNQYLYVNRGIGYIGLPMMSIGVRPEITVIELKK